MNNLKEELMSWLADNNSQWVFDELAKIKVIYEKRSRQLTEEQSETLTRRLQLLSWGKLNFEKKAGIPNVKIAEGVSEDILSISTGAEEQIHEAYLQISKAISDSTDPKAVRAFMIDALEACLYYKIKGGKVLIMGLFRPGTN